MKGLEPNQKLIPGARLYKNELYFDFIEEYPDYAPKAKMTISRTKFYKWVKLFCEYKFKAKPEEGRDSSGRWIIIRTQHDMEKQTEAPF